MIEKIRNCRKCKLYKNQEPLVDKKYECDVMWVGLSAKKVEDVNKNYPLENNTSSGKIIEEIEKKRDDLTFYKTNLVKCLPLNEEGKLRYPTENEMEMCIKNLLMEIRELKPRVVFLLGNNVSKFVTKYCEKNSIKTDVKVFSVEHPSYICVYKRKNKDAYIKKIIDEIEREEILND